MTMQVETIHKINMAQLRNVWKQAQFQQMVNEDLNAKECSTPKDKGVEAEDLERDITHKSCSIL